MLSMENGCEKFESIKSPEVDEEEGEILEDGEIEDAGITEEVPDQEEEPQEVEEQNVDANDEEDESDSDEKKKHKRQHHKRKRRKHDDRKSEEKRSRHKKRKGEEHNDDGEESPSSRKKKKRKKHGRKERESTSPEMETETKQTGSESPPLPSEQNMYAYNYDAYGDAYYNQASEYQDPSAEYPYTEGYQQQTVDYSSGSNSYYSDFESHLAQYQTYKKNNAEGKNGEKTSDKYPSDEDNYYSGGYNETSRRRRRHNESRSTQRSSRTNSSYEERRSKRPNKIRGVTSSAHSNNEERPVCKFFREGHCTKGDKCGFSHHKASHRSRREYSKPKKVMELCQYYASGVCVHGDNCNYMHEDFPCKYFHSGTQCYNGDSCKFSHEPATPATEEIIKKLQSAYSSVDDSEEIKALEKAGIKPLQKPPPGVGLLPTPPINMLIQPQGSNPPKQMPHMRKHPIPSLFDITVAPSAELQQRINNNAVPSLSMTDDELSAHQAALGIQLEPFHAGKGLLPLPNMGNPHVPPPMVQYPPPGLLGGHPKGIRGLQQPQQQGSNEWEDNEMYEDYYDENQQDVNMGDDSIPDQQKHDYNHGDVHDIHDNDEKTDEDVIRMDDHDVIKEQPTQAPSFLPAKQKALFMRIHQKRNLSTEGKTNEPSTEGSSGLGSTRSTWNYSSDEDENKNFSRDPRKPDPSSSVQSILEMISNKKNQNLSNIDAKLLSKVAGVINMTTSSGSTKTSDYITSSTTMMSPPRQPHPRKERKSSSEASPRAPSLRRRLSTSELNKDPVTIPLVVKQSSDSMHAEHPDPRMTLSRLFGQKRREFTAPLPGFYSEELMLSASGKLPGLKITVSSDNSKKRTSDPRLNQPTSRPKASDPRSKGKLNDPRLRGRALSAVKTDPIPPKPSIPVQPSALLSKPPTSGIPSLPELNLDFANISEKSKSPPLKSPKRLSPIAKMPTLSRASVTSQNKPLSNDESAVIEESSKEDEEPTIAPYDPRFITAGSTNKTSTASNRSPYEPRVLTSQANIPPLFDPRATPPELVKHMPLPKLTPAPGYAGKLPNLNGVKGDLPSGEQQDF
uniref:ziinc finger protein Ci-ZF(C3H)-7 isoform X1 n=1 Tax=Ciona intestinalis TaxID=7719 RepID=UPI00089DAA62|nr:ziinc finger protein Ci-ZF(C3H)-7 isoform X1 [Ciona intestinalis]|eukprot:XP_018669106.1 ziinc finger protein Ci-ZF(C3H)-7 isoform X1 [Ciona intestinalis]